MNMMTRLAATAALMTTVAGASHADTIVQIAAADARFSTLVAAVTAAGLADTLSGPGPFTVYAPTNDAFAALPAGTVDSLLLPENKGNLTNVLLYHVDDRKLMARDFPAGSNYFRPILADSRLCITSAGGAVTIGDSTDTKANVIIADIVADNGVIHVIDKVLLPGARPACH